MQFKYSVFHAWLTAASCASTLLLIRWLNVLYLRMDVAELCDR